MQQCMDSMDRFNAFLKDLTGMAQTYVDASSDTTVMGLGGVEGMIHNLAEGQLDTGRMMKALLQRVRELGVEVLTGIGVQRMDEQANCVEVHTSHGFSISTQRVLVTTNAFARELLPELDVRPGRAQVLVTEPIPGLRLRGSCHYDRGYYYFRNVGDRVLFGGGRNLDFTGESTTAFGLTEQIQLRLDELLHNMILPGVAFKIDQRWSGIMGLGPNRQPIVQAVSKKIFCAVRMGGMGVAIGSLVGEDAAQLVLG
jgi:glycine/D-amino acid oxidase-like deaminating enzyme